MRQLSFVGFLEQYLCELSFSKTSSVLKLLKELDSNPRLKEPLILYCAYSKIPISVSKNYPSFYKEYQYISNTISCNKNNSIRNVNVPRKYIKVLDAYEYRINKCSNDNETKMLMRNRIISLQQQRNISNYRIYKDLGMNPGNVNAYLKNGDVKKISLDSARKIWFYVRG